MNSIKKVKAVFRGIETIQAYKQGATSIGLNFDNHYMIELDGNLRPTGRAMQGRGNKFDFEPSELKIIKGQ